MSSLVHKQRQQHVAGAQGSNSAASADEKALQQLPPKKGLIRRSASFEKFLVTAFHIRLACTRCSRESLKFCLEMLIVRSRIIAESSRAAVNAALANLVQLSHEWNGAALQLANVIIPKWQIRARHVVETTILQRQWRRAQEQRVIREEKQQQKAEPKVTPVTESPKQQVVDERPHGSQERLETKGGVEGQQLEVLTDDEKASRQRLTIAVTGCVVFLALQLGVGVTLVIQAGIPLGLIFQLACVFYIAYLLLSICDFSRLNMTTCQYGKPTKTTVVQRVVMKTGGEEEGGFKVLKLVQLSFIEKTMSKVKLL